MKTPHPSPNGDTFSRWRRLLNLYLIFVLEKYGFVREHCVILYSLLTVLETPFIIKIYMNKGGLKWKIEINYKSA